MQQIIQHRVAAFRDFIAEKKIDTFMVLIEENRYYLSGFTGADQQFDETAGALLITQDDLILLTDSRYETQARQEATMYEVIVYREGLAKALPPLLKRLGSRKLGFESVRLTHHIHNNLKRHLKKENCSVALRSRTDTVEQFRLLKSPDEIEKTKAALSIAEEVFLHVASNIKPGDTEKQLAWAMEKGMREAGADGLAFPTIIASGPNSALPHATPSDRPVAAGEPILFDWGAKLNGYCSDTSRTLLIGKPDENFLNVFNTVLEAQKRATDAVKEGIAAKTIDSIARDHINGKGYEGRFGHGLGHGTGLAIHEGPRVSPFGDLILQTGMLFTVEPGVYLPGWGGVRIENQVVVAEDGHYILNRLNTTYKVDDLHFTK